MLFQIDSRIRKLDRYFERAKQSNDDETKSDLARFGIILICGFMERSVEALILEYLQKRAQPRVLRFISSHFKRGTNYDCTAVCSLLERFEVDWRTGYEQFLLENSNVADAVESVYTLRNSIAHGGDASRGLAGVIELYTSAKAMVEGLSTTLQAHGL